MALPPMGSNSFSLMRNYYLNPSENSMVKKKAKILIVEDNIYTSMAMIALISNFSDSYHSCYDGEEALLCVKDQFERHGTTY